MAKISKARFGAASRAAHKAGKPGSNAYKTAFRRALGKRKAARQTRKAAKRTARAAARRRPGEKRRAHVRRRVSHGLSNLTLAGAGEAYVAGEGLYQTLKLGYAHAKAFMSGADRSITFADATKVLGPAVDGAITAKAFHAARTSGLTAPGVKRIMNIKPLKLDLNGITKMNLGQIVDTIPSAAGWGIGLRGYQDKSNYFRGTNTRFPRLAGLTGIVIDGDFKGAHFDQPAFQASALPIAAGGVASKGVHMLRTSGLAPAPVKKVFQLQA